MGGLFIAAAVLADALIGLRAPLSAVYQTAGRPIQVADDGYVSSATCRACHATQYDSWHSSFHRSMTQVATPATVQADFSGTRIVDVQGQPMLLERRGDEFWAEFDDPDRNPFSNAPMSDHSASGDDHRLSSSAGLLVSHWARSRGLARFPALTSLRNGVGCRGRWCFCDRLEPAAVGDWQLERDVYQLSRHAWQGEGRTANRPHGRFDRRGVRHACEACHGPGNHHVDVNRNPLRRYWAHLTGQHDPTMLQPATLEPRAASQVCGQCHGVFGYAAPKTSSR